MPTRRAPLRTILLGGLGLIGSMGMAAGGWAGWLRLSGNVHEFDAGMYRSA